MNRFSLRRVLLAVLLVGNFSPLIPRARATAPLCGSWRIVHSPPAPTYGLHGVATISYKDVWAVAGGNLPLPTIYPINVGFVEHWDGTLWSIVPSPNGGSYDNTLQGIDTLSPDDIWAVGESTNGIGGDRTLVEQWNGQQWSVVPSPSIGTYPNFLREVAGVAPDDLWTVGGYWSYPGDIVNTLTEHWNGSTWSVVASPNPPGGDNTLGGVAALATNDVWATGYAAGNPLILHWDGSQWLQVPSPRGRFLGSLQSIEALNAHNIWAVGMHLSISSLWAVVRLECGSPGRA